MEFLVAEKESVRNIHKRFYAVYGSSTVDRSTIGRWIQRVKASGSGETELHDHGHGYRKRKRAGTGKACMPLFRAGVRT
jgi:transposase